MINIRDEGGGGVDWRINDTVKKQSPYNCRALQQGLTTAALRGHPGDPASRTALDPRQPPSSNPDFPLRPDWAAISGFPWGLAMGLMVQSYLY